ncbi:group III truncated hemoglobin [Flavobacteriaceae bacterium]|nr:group III truncated hemoglobin [Flavobacteriaceae bacterium]
MKPIECQEDIHLLVNTFYSKIRKDELLGPIFNSHISENQWPHHLIKLTDFWETNLFGVRKFKGNPTKKHLKVDENLDYRIDALHFGKWLNLWVETINELFTGERADKAIYMERKMATGQYLTLWNQKPDNRKQNKL